MTTIAASRNRPNHIAGWHSARPLYRYLWRTSRSGQIGICLLSVVITPLSMAILEFQRRIVDDAVGPRNARLLVALGAGYAGVICFRVVLKYLVDILKGRAAETVARDLRLRIMKAAQTIWPQVANDSGEVKAGTVVSMLGVEAEDMSGFAGDALSLPLLNGGTVIWVVGYLLWIEPLIAAIAFLVYLPQLLIVPVTQFTINRLGRLRIRQLRNLGYLAMHARGRAGTTGRIFIERLYRFRIQIYLRKFFIGELGNFLDLLGPLIVLTLGGYLAIIGETQVSTLVVFISGLQKIADPWDQMITFFRTISNTGVMYDMIREKLAGTPGELP